MANPAHFVVLGGGTAGWLAAFILQDAVRRGALDARISVVESSKIPTIGVGEGSTAAMRMLLKSFNIDEFEFLRETEATIKLGIRHVDWRRKGSSYDGPIDDPHQVVAAPKGSPSEYLNVYCVAAERKLSAMHLFGPLFPLKKAPFARRSDGSLIALGPFHHAYHFDQALVGRYLKRKSSGVEIIDAVLEAVELDGASGDIVALRLDGEKRVEADFFIDASGFRRLLIGEALKAKWISYAGELPVNRAMPFWIDHKPDEEIDPYTLAHAMSSGWMWRIPTQKRYGCGYVYNDAMLTPEDAKREIEATLGHKIEVRNDIGFHLGRLETPWSANCLAVGLSSSFLEPLEATSIHGSIVQLMLFAQDYLKNPAAMTPEDRASYNQRIGRQVDDFRTFINTHYVSQRDDTPFWRDVAANRRHEETRQRLAHWRTQMPRREDFPQFLGALPHVEAQLHYPVLDGLGLLDPKVARAEMARDPALLAYARKSVDSLTREYAHAATQALGHAEFLEIVREM